MNKKYKKIHLVKIFKGTVHDADFLKKGLGFEADIEETESETFNAQTEYEKRKINYPEIHVNRFSKDEKRIEQKADGENKAIV